MILVSGESVLVFAATAATAATPRPLVPVAALERA